MGQASTLLVKHYMGPLNSIRALKWLQIWGCTQYTHFDPPNLWKQDLDAGPLGPGSIQHWCTVHRSQDVPQISPRVSPNLRKTPFSSRFYIWPTYYFYLWFAILYLRLLYPILVYWILPVKFVIEWSLVAVAAPRDVQTEHNIHANSNNNLSLEPILVIIWYWFSLADLFSIKKL